ncbi:diguanylate cyclase domain-containing protein [Leeia oryzae]|uniref:diguanylate cyclase domain-containing protein n=1 Tax=Leeia oryzae TaxID=356662 RepID=UPI0003663DC2|nr:diguanylate cyclase [Leeia oryzae]
MNTGAGFLVCRVSVWHRLLCLLVLLLSALSLSADTLEPVSLQLKWRHGFQFAGYYMAKERGYYRDAGLEVNLLEAKPGHPPLRVVEDGEAQYGVGSSNLLLERAAGQPVVVLAVVFQHSPSVILSRQFTSAPSLHDLTGKRVMLERPAAELIAYLKQENVPLSSLTLLPHSFTPQDLIDGKVDAISAYMTNETYYLEKAHFPYSMFSPRASGIDFYGDNLFTTEAELRDHPERARAFRDASLQGWQYAMTHVNETIGVILRKYNPQLSREFLAFEASHMQGLIRTDLLEVGYMHHGRWQHIAQTYASLGLLPTGFSLKGFLYEPETNPVPWKWIFTAVGVVTLLAAVLGYIVWINRRLKQALADSHRTALALRESEERHRLLADHASDVIWTMDASCRFTYVSPSVEKLRGYSVTEVMQQSIAEALTPDSAIIAMEALACGMQAVAHGKHFPEFRGELEQLCKNGSTVWTETTTTGIYTANGTFVGILGVTRDITERKKVESRIHHMAQFDMLTDLPNRALLFDRLGQAIEVAKRNQSSFAVMFLDLDKLKPINDTLGHHIGDLLLIEAANRMRDNVRASDTVARVGGDEFVILLPQMDDKESVVRVAEKVRFALASPFRLDQHVLDSSCSIGIAIYPQHGESEIELLKNADDAMYFAKQHGRNNIHFCDLDEGLSYQQNMFNHDSH